MTKIMVDNATRPGPDQRPTKEVRIPQAPTEGERCCVSVFPAGSMIHHRCLRRSIAREGGKSYCGIHLPSFVAAKRAVKRRRRNDEMKAKEASWRLYDWYVKCGELVETVDHRSTTAVAFLEKARLLLGRKPK